MTEAERIAAGLTKGQREEFLTFDKTEWFRRPRNADERGGRARNHQRVWKCKRLGLIDHRIDAGALWRLTPLGLAVRALILEEMP